MALQPNRFTGQDRLQPGGRGESFQVDMPGYRNQGDRLNRTNMRLNTSEHDVPNIKYQFDYRLPSLFRYGYAWGYNQIVVPKGRIVAIDQTMDLVDFDTQKEHNTLTLANGGVPVRLRKTGDLYRAGGSSTGLVSDAYKGKEVHGIGKEWIPLVGMDSAYTNETLRPFKTEGPVKQFSDAGYAIDSSTGRVVKGGVFDDTVRAANIPIGIIERNEYTRDNDAYNGIAPGPVLTDALVEFPWFVYKDKAEQNPWGSAYGALFPGALMKSDENGRFVISPLSFESETDTMTVREYELERQQVLGQVYKVAPNLLPEGAAIWATWALEDRLNFEDFHPMTWPQNNRSGEDAVTNSPFHSTGKYPGYPYDKAYKNSDLHMLESTARQGNFDARMDPKFQVDNLGIPGLTDGYNAVVRDFDPEIIGQIRYAGGNDYVEMLFRTREVSIEPNSLQVSVGGEAFANCVVGAMLTVKTKQFLRVTYADTKKGMLRLEVTDKAVADAVLGAEPTKQLEVKAQYKKRGLAGVPTFMDWDGCVGSVNILMTK